jgi:hypothetical protein
MVEPGGQQGRASPQHSESLLNIRINAFNLQHKNMTIHLFLINNIMKMWQFIYFSYKNTNVIIFV